jgi:hypothetical protein
MSKLINAAAILALTTTVATAHHENEATPVQTLASVSDDGWTVTNWYKQSIFDPGDNKIGEIKDVILDHDGKASAVMIGVGGFLGIGAKDVAVPYAAVHFKLKDQKWYPFLNANKDALMSAPGFKFDQNAMKWVPENTAGTIGRSAPQK